jgi:hypothetical protein
MRQAIARNLIVSALLSMALGLASTIRFALPAVPRPADDPPLNVDDQGVFEIFQAGQQLGTEQFKIAASKDGVQVDDDAQLRVEQLGQKLMLKTISKLSLDSHLQPLDYAWSQQGSQSSSLDMDLKSSPAKITYTTVSGAKDERAFQLVKDVAILDSNVFIHYEILLDRYLATSHGKQEFPAFIPQQATPGLLTVKEGGTQTKLVHGQNVKLRHFEVKSDLATIDLWTDDQNHLEVLALPQASLEVIRQ